MVGIEVKGKTLAIVGLGKGKQRYNPAGCQGMLTDYTVGLTVARAAGGLGMNVKGYGKQTEAYGRHRECLEAFPKLPYLKTYAYCHTSLLDPYANTTLAAAANVELLPTLAELLTSADFLTLHTPMIASTKGLIGTAELSTMKPAARVLNVARGGIIDEAALLAALEAGTIAGAGIDVFTSEPPQPGDDASKLIAHPKVVATPHLGKHSDTERARPIADT